MRADNSPYLREASRRRKDAARDRAETTLEQLTAAGEALTVAAFARTARVSRSWLYQQPDLLRRLHETTPTTRTSRPAEAASDASLLRRLHVAHERIRELTQDNQRLKQQLAASYGHLRAARAGRATAPPEPATHAVVKEQQ